MHTLVLLYVEDTLEDGVTQTHTVLVFIVLYYQKVSLASGCSGEDCCQTAYEPLQYQVRVVESVPSILAMPLSKL